MYGYAVIQSFARLVASRPSQSTQGDAPRPKVENTELVKTITQNNLHVQLKYIADCYRYIETKSFKLALVLKAIFIRLQEPIKQHRV